MKNRSLPLVALALLAAFGLIGLAQCSRGPDLPPVILVTFDTTRADHLSCYGYSRKTTPRVDELIAANSVRFDRMTAAANNTSCSFASVHTGVHVKTHGVIKLAPFGYPVDPAFKTLGEVLRECGYFAVAAVGAAHLNGDKDGPGGDISGLGRGFDKFFNHRVDRNEIKRPCEDVNAALIPYLEETFGRRGERKPLFLWLHYFDPHTPYKPPPPFDTAFEHGSSVDRNSEAPPGFVLDPADAILTGNLSKQIALYDGEILRADHAMSQVLDTLRKLGILDKAIIVFTADHGENLGEHDLYFNHLSLYQPVVHVPLLVHLPGMTGSRTSDALVHHVDLLPTILDAVGAPASRWPKGLEGQSLLPLLQQKTQAGHERVYSEAAHHREKMVREDRFKLIVDGTLQKEALYDLATDPGETRNVAGENAATAAELLADLEAFVGLTTYHFQAVPGPGASADETFVGRVRSRKELPRIAIVSSRTSEKKTSVPAINNARTDFSVRFDVAPGQDKGIVLESPYGALLLDIASTKSPLDSNAFWLGTQKPTKETTLPYVFCPGEEKALPERAPSLSPALVRVESLEVGAAKARYRITLSPCEPELTVGMGIRFGTDGSFADPRGTSGTLIYSGGDSPDRFRVRTDDIAKGAVFEFDVVPATGRLFIEGKIDSRRISNLEFRRGPAGQPDDDRSYPTTLFISPNVSTSDLGSAAVLKSLESPGFHFWTEPKRERLGSSGEMSEEMRTVLEKLGYIAPGGGGGGAKPKKSPPASNPGAVDPPPGPDKRSDSEPPSSAPGKPR